jgi:hypothetical protein
VLEQELGALEAGRQLLADRLLDDARPGEADQRVRLGEDHVAEHRHRGGDAAGGRVEEHGDERHPRLAQPRPRRRGLRHLHEAQHALLHPGASRRAEHHGGPLVRDRALELARDLLADHRAHRAAHELEHEEADLDRDAADLRGRGAIRVAAADLLRLHLDRVRVLLAVDPEAEPVGRLEPEVVLLPGALVDDHLDPCAGRHPEVVAAARADPEVGVEIGVVQRRRTALALGPNPLRDGLFRLRRLRGEPLRA